jgi:hypothetical protein
MRRPRTARPVGSLVAALLLFAAHAVDAHPGNPPAASPTPAVTPAGAPAVPPRAPLVTPTTEMPGLTPTGSPARPVGALVAVVLALGGAVTWRSRRVTVCAQALVLVVFVAESSLHSVHHIADPAGAAGCQVLPVSQQLTGHLPSSAPAASAPAVAGSLVAPAAQPPHAGAPLRPDLGRAPPLPG